MHGPNCEHCALRAEKDRIASGAWLAVALYIGGGLLCLWLGRLFF